LASKSTGTRISGPLFFGFSDPVVQKMIEALPGYETWQQILDQEAEQEVQAQLTHKTRPIQDSQNPDL